MKKGDKGMVFLQNVFCRQLDSDVGSYQLSIVFYIFIYYIINVNSKQKESYKKNNINIAL